MSFLASVVGGKLNYLPTTDLEVKKLPFISKSKRIYKTKRQEKIRREIILKELIPFPEQIELNRLRKFKNDNSELLNRFKNKVELIALDHSVDEESQLFKEAIKELNFSKDELTAKMNEGKIGKIFFGTICGITGAVIEFASTGTVASFSALPSLANAIYSALQIENVNNISDQSGMKYLALVDKKLRKPRH